MDICTQLLKLFLLQAVKSKNKMLFQSNLEDAYTLW